MIKPGDLDLEEFRRVGYQTIDAIAAYHERLDARPVLPQTTPADVAARFTDDFAEYGEPAEALLADWRERVAPLLTAIGSPRHFAFVNGSGAMIGVFAEALAAAVNTNAGAWKLGPAATEIERQLIRWIVRGIALFNHGFNFAQAVARRRTTKGRKSGDRIDDF